MIEIFRRFGGALEQRRLVLLPKLWTGAVHKTQKLVSCWLRCQGSKGKVRYLASGTQDNFKDKRALKPVTQRIQQCPVSTSRVKGH